MQFEMDPLHSMWPRLMALADNALSEHVFIDVGDDDEEEEKAEV
eukprot:CAMPEP_0197047672 /NCGR_PEP_ID=MMETSP1384-20130603/23146_1 /TAXON_ID=29189 /ORGANISM="Ammonia sp." /LENGTH=43 /DNA_ID= /DNA_START= /DNA_END= /DNA_ORIENTATION=